MAPITDNFIQPFQLENIAARGRMVRLGKVVEDVLGNHDYPEPVALLLGELLALAALVSGALKFDGVFTVQAKGDGPVKTLVADINTDGNMRGYAQFDEERLDAELRGADPDGWRDCPVPRLLGAGYLAFTVDQGPDTERFQGIVELVGAQLADSAHNYIRQSEQLDAVVLLASGIVPGPTGGAEWRAGGVMIQRLPNKGRRLLSGETRDDKDEDDWVRAVALMSSTSQDELLNVALHPHDLLYRLYYEDGVRVFESRSLAMFCRCTQEKVVGMLQSFPRTEIEQMTVDDEVVVTCEFCGLNYKFDQTDLNDVYAS
jgi:molecular chaperone Hsp33